LRSHGSYPQSQLSRRARLRPEAGTASRECPSESRAFTRRLGSLEEHRSASLCLARLRKQSKAQALEKLHLRTENRLSRETEPPCPDRRARSKTRSKTSSKARSKTSSKTSFSTPLEQPFEVVPFAWRGLRNKKQKSHESSQPSRRSGAFVAPASHIQFG
jgi:hypothetical protein